MGNVSALPTDRFTTLKPDEDSVIKFDNSCILSNDLTQVINKFPITYLVFKIKHY